MITLLKTKTLKTSCAAETDQLAQRIARQIINCQKSCARLLQKAIRKVPFKIQRIGFTVMMCAGAFYCGALIFGTDARPLMIKTIKPLKKTRVSSADSLQKLENIYQHYLKR